MRLLKFKRHVPEYPDAWTLEVSRFSRFSLTRCGEGRALGRPKWRMLFAGFHLKWGARA